MPVNFGGPGVTPSAATSNPAVVALNAGEVSLIPSGRWACKPGKYTSVQVYDPISLFWRPIGGGATSAPIEIVFSDGENYRLANQTGCAVGALITNAGTGYTSAPVVTASSGASVWRAIVGGALNTSITVTNAGTNYTYPPTVTFAPPPAGGIQATGYCTLSSGTVSSVTVTDQGAGYTSAPTITFTNDPREGLNGTTVGYNAAATCVLTGAGTITGLVCVDHGNAVTVSASTAVPTLAFSGGGGSSAAATIVMCLTITSYAVSLTTAGSGYIAPIVVSGYGGFPATSPAYTNVTTQSQLLKGRNAFIAAAISGTALTATGQTVYDGGIYPGAPTMFAYGGFPVATGAVGATFLTPNMGGTSDISEIWNT